MTTSAAAAWMLASYIASETFTIFTERHIISDRQLPQSFHNLKVCFISDLHHGRYSSVRRLQYMVKKINRLQADLILLGGDYLQTFRRPVAKQRRDLQELLKVLGALHHPPLGIYGVLGNHDYQLPTAWVVKEFAKQKIIILNNQGVALSKNGEHIFLAGVEDSWYGKPSWQQASQTNKNADFKLLIAHQPNFIDELKVSDGVNFVFAGHTHGMQINMFHYFPFLPKSISRWEYRVGLVSTKQTRMLVSPGIGTAPPYFRFGSPAKIHLVTFKSLAK